MKFSRRSFLKAGALAAAACGAQLPAGAAPAFAPPQGLTRPTACGPVRGAAAGPGCCAWYGIPYGAAPAGSLRWQPPQDPDPWAEPLDCTAPGPIALQSRGGAAAGSEDCLRLDIHAPEGAAGLPVAVYFHGGGDLGGSGRELAAGRLAAGAECVVVTVGHRLGLLGWNCLPSLLDGPGATGSFALLDAARALDWVGENIAAFGGDPDNMTALGFSAGAQSVLAMLASPRFAGRFRRAAAFSGGLAWAEPGAAARQTACLLAPLAVSDGLAGTEEEAARWLLEGGAEVRRWLCELEPARLCLPQRDGLGLDSFPRLFADGVLLPEGGPAAAEWNDLPLLLVTGRTEFSLLGPLPSWYEENGLSRAGAAAARRFATRYGSALCRLFHGADCAAALPPGREAPVWLCELACGAPDSRSPLPVLGAGSYHGLWLDLLAGENGLAGAADLSGPGWAAAGAALTGILRAFLRGESPGWAPWTPGAPRALALDADNAAGTAPTELVDAPAGAASLLGEMEADESLSPAGKELVVRRVLKGRSFSVALDEKYT